MLTSLTMLLRLKIFCYPQRGLPRQVSYLIIFISFLHNGVSGTIVIAESHVAIHTWPEYNYAAVDIFTCGETIDPWVIQEYIKDAFLSKNISSIEMKRGLFKVAPGEELLFKPKDAGKVNILN